MKFEIGQRVKTKIEFASIYHNMPRTIAGKYSGSGCFQPRYVVILDGIDEPVILYENELQELIEDEN